MEVSQHQPLDRKQSALLRGEREEETHFARHLSPSRDSLPASLILHASCASDPDGELEPLSSISLTKRTHPHHAWPASPSTKRQRIGCPTDDELSLSLPNGNDLLAGEPSHEIQIATDERLHICKWDECFKEFTSLKDLGQHLRSHIEKQKDTNRQSKKSGYVCKWENCSRTNPFKGCYNLEHHLRYQHTGERPFQCNSCTSSFAQRSDLTEHLQNIHNMQPSSRRKQQSNPPGPSGLPPFAPPYPLFEANNSAEKIHQLMTPRSRPIPILPAPLAHAVGPIAEYPFLHHGSAAVDTEARAQTSYGFGPMPVSSPSARYIVRGADGETALMNEEGTTDFSHLMTLPLRTSEGDTSGLYSITQPNNFIPLTPPNRTIPHPYGYEYGDVPLDHSDTLDWLDPGESL